MDSRRPRPQRSPDPFDRRLDRWLDTGRQLVDGVSGARPGRRGVDRLDGASRLDAMGRWVGDRIDWLLDEEDDWREPPEPSSRWDSPRSPSRSSESSRSVSARSSSASRMERPVSAGRKRPLEAMSRRQPVLPPPPAVEPSPPAPSVQPDPVVSEADDAWPDDDNFRVDRWKRSSGPSSPSPADPSPVDPAPMAPPRTSARRPLPRSSRRRD
ncbi:RNA helicase [Synechococcus sp. NOUM97013]|uniref:RNA helicase n=1 Tax=Synechococcus sp. NOUM97013 TaxID=1442555 RepID=UPI0016457668|nr:RNA helicase [Synechococcus sp. NOUM97013]QNI74863.1 viral RNA helicase/ superfamily I [Synechococcus sp. NOUM97013]